MPENALSLLAKNYAIAHGRVIESAEGTDDRHFGKSVGPRVHSVAWQVWHIARWDDRFGEIIVAKTPELAGLSPPRAARPKEIRRFSAAKNLKESFKPFCRRVSLTF